MYFYFDISFHNVEALCSVTSSNRTVVLGGGDHTNVHTTHRHTDFEESPLNRFGAYLGEGAFCFAIDLFQCIHAYFGDNSHETSEGQLRPQ